MDIRPSTGHGDGWCVQNTCIIQRHVRLHSLEFDLLLEENNLLL